jgi:hypothetical protein
MIHLWGVELGVVWVVAWVVAIDEYCPAPAALLADNVTLVALGLKQVRWGSPYPDRDTGLRSHAHHMQQKHRLQQPFTSEAIT